MTKRTPRPLFPRIGAFLAGNPADDTVLSYLGRLAKDLGADEILIRLEGEGGAALRSARSRIRKRIAEIAGKRMADRVDVAQYNQDGLQELLILVRDDDLDLLVAGRRLPSSRGSRTGFFQELARKAPCTTLLVTQHSEPEFDRILVAADFSEHSARATKLALRLQSKLGSGRRPVDLQHVFEIPYKGSEHFAEHRKEDLREEFTRFLEEYRISGRRVNPIATDADHPSRAITSLAGARGAQLVVVGSKGRSRLAQMFLGSTAGELVAECAAAVLVVKERGETMNFLDALKQA